MYNVMYVDSTRHLMLLQSCRNYWKSNEYITTVSSLFSSISHFLICPTLIILEMKKLHNHQVRKEKCLEEQRNLNSLL